MICIIYCSTLVRNLWNVVVDCYYCCCCCCMFVGETDWKLIAISTADPWSGLLHDIHDVAEYLPGTLESIKEWFRTYKTFDGKEANTFGMNGEYQNAAFAKALVRSCHESWKHLLSGAYSLEEGEPSPVAQSPSKRLPNSGNTRKLSYPRCEGV